MRVIKYPVWLTVEEAKDVETFLTVVKEPLEKQIKKCKIPKIKKDGQIAVDKLNNLINKFKETEVINNEMFCTEEAE